jgi:hypothetical protein
MKLSKKERQDITDFMLQKADINDAAGNLDSMLSALDDPVGKADIAFRRQANHDDCYKPKKLTLEIQDWELGAIFYAIRNVHYTSMYTYIYDAYQDIANKLRGAEK